MADRAHSKRLFAALVESLWETAPLGADVEQDQTTAITSKFAGIIAKHRLSFPEMYSTVLNLLGIFPECWAARLELYHLGIRGPAPAGTQERTMPK